MAKLITRYFEDAKVAREVVSELVYRERFSRRIIDVVESKDGLVDRLTSLGVSAKTAKAYEKRMASGGAVLSVKASHKPLGVAQTARNVVKRMGAVDLGDLVEEVIVQETGRSTLSILWDHPHMLTKVRDPNSSTFHMADWPIPLISRRKPFKESLFRPHARMANFPIPLISSRQPYTGSIFPRHSRMANFLMPLISRRKPYTRSIFPRHARMASFPIPLLSKRKPYSGTIIGKHTRMANWPFPHLINSKTGTNALMPGGPRMANFPISLLTRRKPFDKSIFPRHARMASFPISLTSRRKPFTGSIFSRHARMANYILPLVLRSSEQASGKKAKGFSLSGMLGLPTVLRR